MRQVSTPYHLTQKRTKVPGLPLHISRNRKKIWSRFSAIRFFLSWLPGYVFSCCTFFEAKSRGIYLCIFVLAPDGSKKCTPIPVHIHRKCTGIYVDFLNPGKARLPEPKPSRLSWLLPMPSVIRSHSGNCVLRRSGRSLVNKRDAFPWSVHPSPYIMPYSTRTDASRASK